jgi:hypothetical protein
MAREGYPSRRRKCNNFNAYGVFGRDKCLDSAHYMILQESNRTRASRK